MDVVRAPPGERVVTALPIRVGLDLDGSLESLGDSMTDLADALSARGGCALVRFHSRSRAGTGDVHLACRRFWAPWWRRGMGRSLDRLLPTVDVVHVAGVITPPTRRVPEIVTVDDLRPLRGESRMNQRSAQLRRLVARGAIVVASSHVARDEVLAVLGVARDRVVVVSPAVPLVAPNVDGDELVVNVTGDVEHFVRLAPSLAAAADRLDTRLVALTSAAAAARIRSTAVRSIELRPRRDAREVLGAARVVVHISDGARFPSFAIAALGAGVPTITRSTPINRELLAGAAILAESDAAVVEQVDALWNNEQHRALAVAAGRSRALDFSPSSVAGAYLDLYGDVVRGWDS